TANFLPILAPANQQTYDTLTYYNTASAILIGAGAGACSFRLIPPLSPAFRTRRWLALTLRDLRRLARSRIWRTPEDWEGRIYGRLSAVPDSAEPLPGTQILAALFVGTAIIQLRRIAHSMDLRSELNAALEALRRGNIALTTARLDRLDGALAARPGAAALQARARVLAMCEVLTQHAAYFEAGETG
ncbi:MAG TPA: FUSC family protein, partial [Stellaceae bacterium]|nr:FUSC family protein [Stellaceae bacterium]